MWDRTFAEQAFQQQIIHYTVPQYLNLIHSIINKEIQVRDGNLFYKPTVARFVAHFAASSKPSKPCPWYNHVPRLPVWGVLLGELGQLVLHGHSALAVPSVQLLDQLGPAGSSCLHSGATLPAGLARSHASSKPRKHRSRMQWSSGQEERFECPILELFELAFLLN